MPVGPTDSRRAVLIAIAGLVTALGLGALVWIVASSDTGTTTSSGNVSGLQVETLIRFQESDGVPFCVDDLAEGNRLICIFHVGDDPEAGWVAYDAQHDGCVPDDLRNADELVICGERFPFTGEGLTQYPVEVADGVLSVDLDGEDGEDDEPETTTTTILVTGDP